MCAVIQKRQNGQKFVFIFLYYTDLINLREDIVSFDPLTGSLSFGRHFTMPNLILFFRLLEVYERVYAYKIARTLEQPLSYSTIASGDQAAYSLPSSACMYELLLLHEWTGEDSFVFSMCGL